MSEDFERTKALFSYIGDLKKGEYNVTIVEGPDGAGKSTLVKKFQEACSNNQITVHHGPYKGVAKIADLYLASLFPSNLVNSPMLEFTVGIVGADVSGPKQLILDRCWLSEYIYGPIYRGGTRIDERHERIFQRALFGLDPVVIYCQPPLETCIQNMKGRAKDEYLIEDLERYRRVWLGYARQARDITFEYGPPIIYDYTRDPDASFIIKRLETVRPFFKNDGPGYGVWKPGESTLIVGDRPGVSRDTDIAVTDVPFAGLNPNGCSLWLSERLASADILERSLYWVNSKNRNGFETDPEFIQRLNPTAIIALGSEAAMWLAKGGYAGKTYMIQHPSYVKRYNQKNTDYANLTDVVKLAYNAMARN